ncbi:MAG: hypothetical protein OHK0012_20370 [Synechococcales cyanobacterium]
MTPPSMPADAMLNPVVMDGFALDTDLPQSFQALIATAITTLTSDPIYENHTAGHTWKFTYGTVQVFVHLTGESPSDILTVWASVLPLPVKKQMELLEALLMKNWSETLEARFCLWNDQVVLNHTRSLDGLNVSEMTRAITVVATLADEYDEVLAAEFNS